jgi:metal-responsive CopG/Arc/MetJ family transcriptional regulator
MVKMSNRNPNLKTIGVSLPKDAIAKSDQIVDNRLISGVSNRSALIEYALRKVFDEVFKEHPQTETQTQPEGGKQ